MNKIFILVLIVIPKLLQAQSQDGAKFQTEYQLHMKKAKGTIKVDGVHDEADWANANIAKDFWQKFPTDDRRSIRPTEVKATFDDKYLYFAAICHDTSAYIIQTLKRDVNYWQSDGLAFILDPVNQKSNGFLFGVSPLNVQSEDLLSADGGGDAMNFSWDNKWFSATKNFDTYWTVEIAIPFKTLRFNENNTVWGINFVRTDMKSYTYNSWTHVPVQFLGTDFGYNGALVWDEAPQKPKFNASIIPYITGSVLGNKEEGNGAETQFNGGLDAKVSLSAALNLDVTVNPDFSQIEVDQQVTNLTRFNIFLPERRTFFLENDDIFSNFGAPPFRPFYSRSIGLDRNGRTLPILGGLRLSGNMTKSLRIGLMNMQTRRVDDTMAKERDTDISPAQNYTAVTFNQRIGARSSIKGYMNNRTANMTTAEETAKPIDKYGRTAGVEFNYTDAAGKWVAWAGLHGSSKPTISSQNSFVQMGVGHFLKNFSFFIDAAAFKKDFYTDMGYVNRIETNAVKGASYADGDTVIRGGFAQVFSEIEYQIRPKTGKINGHRFGIETFVASNPDGSLGDYFNRFRYFLNFRNTASLRFRIDPQYTKLLYYTALPSIKPLAPGGYGYVQYNVQYNSDNRKTAILEASYRGGGFYNGSINQYVAGLTFRRQPWGNFNFNYEQNNLNFPDQFGDEVIRLFNNRTEINFSNSIFWTTFVQYNTQRNNLNINSRLQYRYSPMSDFFLVYTDNYLVDPTLKNRNRALVFKLNYWLTV